MTNHRTIAWGLVFASAAIVLLDAPARAREIDARGGDRATRNDPDESCAAACRRWRECGMAGEETRCAADCAGSGTFEELPRPHRGAAYCRVGVYREGADVDARPCGTPGKVDRYRAAVIDLAKSRLTVVFKNYY